MIRKSGNILFIEGTRDDTNGDLRVGFANLFQQILFGKMPRIVMGDDNQETINKFKNSHYERIPYSLIDLDDKGNSATQGNYSTLKKIKRESLNLLESDLVFFMVQKM